MNQTDAEILLWQHMRDQALGTKILRQFIIADYIVDFVSLQHQLVIEVDGAYHAELEQQRYDASRTERLEHLGFRVLRFSNEEIFNNIDFVINQIKNNINNNE